MASASFRDPDFQDRLVGLVCRDRKFLRECGHMLEADDFKPRKHETLERWIVATVALEFFKKYREKIGDMLRSEMLDFARKQNYRDDQKKNLLAYVQKIADMKIVGVDHITERVVEYKQERMRVDAIQEIIEAQGLGELTNDRFMDICRKVVNVTNGNGIIASEFFDDNEMENRIDRRFNNRTRRFPYLFIDPIDQNVRIVARGHLGLLMGPYKKGKSLGLTHIAMAYVLQSLNVLYFTLEDPKPDVEDRMDAMISNLPLKRLHELPQKFRNRFHQYKRLVRGRLQVIDGTEGGISVNKMVSIYEMYRNQGFTADAVIADYDEFISPSKKLNERRMEFDQIYTDFKRFISKNQLIGWLAAQTKRKTENKKVIVGDDAAEDISKIRKASCCVGIGQGDWGDNSLYLQIVAHKYDRQHVGWNIMSDRDRMIFYDRDETLKQQKLELEAKRQDEGEED